jgi:polyhydroxyalkanoate synthesis regulator phasin
MSEAWQSYLEMALGLTKTSRKRAEKVVKELVGKGNAKAGELQAMAESLVATGLTNREALTKLVQAELDRALTRVGLAKADEVAELNRRVAQLEARLAGTAAAPPSAVPATPPVAPVVKKTVAKRSAPTMSEIPATPATPPAKVAAKKTKAAARKAA